MATLGENPRSGVSVRLLLRDVVACEPNRHRCHLVQGRVRMAGMNSAFLPTSSADAFDCLALSTVHKY